MSSKYFYSFVKVKIEIVGLKETYNALQRVTIAVELSHGILRNRRMYSFIASAKLDVLKFPSAPILPVAVISYVIMPCYKMSMSACEREKGCRSLGSWSRILI